MDIGRDQFFRLPEGDFKLSVFKIFRKQLMEIRMILGKIFRVFHYVVVKRAIQHDLTFCWGVNGVVDEDIGIFYRISHAQSIGAEGQIVIPGQNTEDSVFLIQKVIVTGMPQITVPIHHENLHGEIAQYLVHIDRGLQVFS